MTKRRLVFIHGNSYHDIGICEWPRPGNIQMAAFDPVAEWEKCKAHHAPRLDDCDLVIVMYPTGSPGLIEYTEDIDYEVGDVHRLSRVTKFQTVVGMMDVELTDETL